MALPEKQYFEINHRGINLPFAFLTTTGTVLATDQSSVSHVTGESTLQIKDGTGFGTSSVRTEVQTTRDVWLRTDSGAEKHFRYFGDVPIRTGQTLHHVALAGPGVANSEHPYALINANTGDIHWICGGSAVEPTFLVIPKGAVSISWFWIAMMAVGFLFWIIPGIVVYFVTKKTYINRQWTKPMGQLIYAEFSKLKALLT